MMDIYEAIEIVERMIDIYDIQYNPSFTEEEEEAIKVCLEAARDKAGV